MLIFVRHGERLDQVKEIPPGMKVDFAYDPQLTPAGMKMDSDALGMCVPVTLVP